MQPRTRINISLDFTHVSTLMSKVHAEMQASMYEGETLKITSTTTKKHCRIDKIYTLVLLALIIHACDCVNKMRKKPVVLSQIPSNQIKTNYTYTVRPA